MKAKITAVSEVDAAGIFETTYEIYDDQEKVLYTNLVVRAATADEARAAITARMQTYQLSMDESKKIQVGEEIEI